MKIYLAGKISHTDWRHKIVSDLHGALGYDLDNLVESMNRVDARWPIYRKSIFGEHDYVGPFFLACDHGCAHGADQHGIAANCITEKYYLSHDEVMTMPHRDLQEDEKGFYEEGMFGGGCISTSSGSVRGEYVVGLCNRAIDACDLFFAWIDAPDCYGTLVELGYAKALKKKVWVAGPTRFSDMWFAYRSADKVSFEHQEAVYALGEMLDKRINYYAYIKSDEWRAKAEDAKRRADHRCQVCNRPRTEVTLDAHHRTYERLGRELPTDITVLCRSCHELYEKNKKKTSNGVSKTDDKFDFLWKKS